MNWDMNVTNFNVLTQNLSGRTEEHHEKFQSVHPFSGSRFEPGTFRIQDTTDTLIL